MSELIGNYLGFLEYEKGCQKNTIQGYKTDLQLLIKFLDKPLEEVKTRDLRSFLTHLGETRGNKQSSIHRRICSMKSFFKFIKDEGIILVDPSEKISYPKRRKSLPKFLTVEEVQKLLDFDKPLAHQTMIEVLYATGCRVQELVNFNISDINYKESSIRVTEGKGGKDRIVMITPRANEVLKEYLTRDYSEEEQVREGIEKNYRSRIEKINYLKKVGRFIPEEKEEPIFLGRSGGRIKKRSVQHIVKMAGYDVDLDVTPHKLRHSMASHLTMGGLNIRVLQKLLGHSSLDTTALYASVTLDHIKAEYQARSPIK